jgi:hypothetical protein
MASQAKLSRIANNKIQPGPDSCLAQDAQHCAVSLAKAGGLGRAQKVARI